MKFTIKGKTFEVADAEITKAIEEKKESMEITTDLSVRTAEEEAIFVENHKKEARKEGVEIAVKTTRTELGLNFEGKTIDNLVKAVQAKTLEEAKIEPTEQNKKLQTQLQEKEAALQAAITKATEAENREKSYKSEVTIDRVIEQSIPEKTILPKEDIKTLLKTKMKFSTDENGKVIVLNEAGEVIKNPTTADPMAAKDVVEDFFKTNKQYVQGVQGGFGGGDDGGSGDKITMTKFIEQMTEKGVPLNGDEFNSELKKLQDAQAIDIEN